jgi:hypothetical protein
LGPKGIGHPLQGPNTFYLKLMKEVLFYDTTSSDPIIIVVGKVPLLLIFTASYNYFFAGDCREAEECLRKRLRTQRRSEQIAHLKGLFYQSMIYIASFLPHRITFRHKHSVTDINSKDKSVSSSTVNNNQNLEKLASPVQKNISVLQHLIWKLRQLFPRFKVPFIFGKNWAKNVTRGSSHRYDDKFASQEVQYSSSAG